MDADGGSQPRELCRPRPGADDAKVDAWLRAGTGVPGYTGFAIGRSIFGQSIKGVSTATMDREAATALVARNYARFISVYEGRS